MDLALVKTVTDRLRESIGRLVMGQERAVTLLLCALLAEGHVLLEGVPGTAKTLLARCFAAALRLRFKRIQFTPDLMPADVIGTNIFNFQTNQFVLVEGPIFTQILLADELNRTPPKTQAALLEAMQEHAVTIEGTTRRLGPSFLVVATQNPVEQEGTYPLPEAQLDRFLFKIVIDYPTRDDERALVRLHGNRSGGIRDATDAITPVVSAEELDEVRQMVMQLHVSDEIVDYVVDLVRATRSHPAVLCGASPRAAAMLTNAARAFAALEGTPYVIPDIIKELAGPVLAHRLVLAPGAEIEGLDQHTVLARILEAVPAPR